MPSRLRAWLFRTARNARIACCAERVDEMNRFPLQLGAT